MIRNKSWCGVGPIRAAPLLLPGGTADLEQFHRFVVGGQMRLGVEDTRDLLCVLYSIGAQFLETSRGLRRDVAQPQRGRQYQPIHALRVMDAERLGDQTAERRAVSHVLSRCRAP